MHMLAHSCTHCCHGKATVCSICIADLQLAVKNIINIASGHGNTTMHSFYCCATYVAANNLKHILVSGIASNIFV